MRKEVPCRLDEHDVRVLVGQVLRPVHRRLRALLAVRAQRHVVDLLPAHFDVLHVGDAVRPGVRVLRQLDLLLLTSGTPRTWELDFQMLNAPALSGPTLRATSGSAQGCVDVYNAPGAFAVTTGFPIAPESDLPDQYQARYSVSTASTQLVAVTIIRKTAEACR